MADRLEWYKRYLSKPRKARWSDKLLAAKIALACKDVVWGTYLEQREEEEVEDEMAQAALEVIQKWRANG